MVSKCEIFEFSSWKKGIGLVEKQQKEGVRFSNSFPIIEIMNSETICSSLTLCTKQYLHLGIIHHSPAVMDKEHTRPTSKKEMAKNVSSTTEKVFHDSKFHPCILTLAYI